MTGGREEATPWGWWLRLDGRDFHDDEGGCWRSVRDAFWRGHLRMPDVHYAEEQQELMLRVLTAIGRRGVMHSNMTMDLFDGDAMTWRFYLCWLVSIGMLDMGERLPMREVVEAVARSEWNLADEAREDALLAFERAVGRRRWTFARKRLPNAFLVTLTGIDSHARMPTVGVMWSLRFGEERPRDDLFAWLAAHVDRWDDRGERAYRKGANEFTRHLLTLFVADERR